MQVCEHGQVSDKKYYNYITDDDFIRDIRDHTSIVELLPNVSGGHITAGRCSRNPC